MRPAGGAHLHARRRQPAAGIVVVAAADRADARLAHTNSGRLMIIPADAVRRMPQMCFIGMIFTPTRLASHHDARSPARQRQQRRRKVVTDILSGQLMRSSAAHAACGSRASQHTCCFAACAASVSASKLPCHLAGVSLRCGGSLLLWSWWFDVFQARRTGDDDADHA
jgi:hypothetical protein